MLLRKCCQQRRQEGHADTLDGRDKNRAGLQPSQHIQFGDRSFERRGDAPDMAEEDFACRRQLQSSTFPLDQRHAKRVFQLGDLPRHRRRGDVELARAFAHGKQLRNGLEIDYCRLVEHAGEQGR